MSHRQQNVLVASALPCSEMYAVSLRFVCKLLQSDSSFRIFVDMRGMQISPARMLREPKLDLKKAINMCRSSEVAEKQHKKIGTDESKDKVHFSARQGTGAVVLIL
jgi:hypothetical protein